MPTFKQGPDFLGEYEQLNELPFWLVCLSYVSFNSWGTLVQLPAAKWGMEACGSRRMLILKFWSSGLMSARILRVNVEDQAAGRSGVQ